MITMVILCVLKYGYFYRNARHAALVLIVFFIALEQDFLLPILVMKKLCVDKLLPSCVKCDYQILLL